MSEEPTFADLAVLGIPFELTPPFEFVEIPIPIDIFDALVSRYLPGRAPGWVDFDREQITPVRFKYRLRQSELGEIGAVELYKTGNDESAMFVSPPSLKSEPREIWNRRKDHNRRVTQTLFGLLAQDSTWQKYWKKAKEKWNEAPNQDTTNLIHHLNTIAENFEDLKRGQAAICWHIDHRTQLAVQEVLDAIRFGRLEQGDMRRTLDAVRRVLKYQHGAEGALEKKELTEALNKIYESINSDLDFHQGLELTIPIIPLLLQYKVDVGAGVDLASVWNKLVQNARC